MAVGKVIIFEEVLHYLNSELIISYFNTSLRVTSDQLRQDVLSPFPGHEITRMIRSK